MKNQIYAICAVKALIVCDKEFLVLSKETLTRLSGFTWNDLPGGRIEHGELSPQNSLRRELREEIGNLTIDIITPIHMTTIFLNPDAHIMATVFLCTANSKKVVLSSEHADYRWISLESTELPLWIKDAADKAKQSPQLVTC